MRTILALAVGLVLVGCAARLPVRDDAVASVPPARSLAARFHRCESEGVLREAEVEAERFRRHRLNLFLGYTRERGEEGGQTVGLDYLFRFDRHWGVGAFVDLAAGGVDSTALGVGLDFHPIEPVFLFVGPGIEWVEEESQGLIRVGAGYEFEVGERTVLGPSAYVDFLEDGEVVWIVGALLGYSL